MTTNQQKQKQSSRWGSLLSGAVAGLESRLDTILTDDSEASAKSRAAELAAATEAKAPIPAIKEDVSLQVPSDDSVARSPSRSRANDRLQEKLARAMNNRSASQATSGVSTPALATPSMSGADSPRQSSDFRPSSEITFSNRVSNDFDAGNVDSAAVSGAPKPSIEPAAEPNDSLAASNLPINPARQSIDSTQRPESPDVLSDSVEALRSNVDPEIYERSTAELQAEIAQLREDREKSDNQKQEEMDTLLERIDALQAKLQFLAKDSVAAAKEANSNSPNKSMVQRLAEKDERIALLMEEGVQLSKTEMRHLATVRRLTGRVTSEEQTSCELRRQVALLKQADGAARVRLVRLQQIEKDNTKQTARMSKVEAELAASRVDLETREAQIVTFKKRLDDAQKQIERLEAGAQKSSLVADTQRIGDLEEQIANSKIEKKLAEDRAKAEMQRVSRELEQQKSTSSSLELELRTEITSLEARMEALRLRAEEVSSDSTGDAQAKLLRQIETAQTQYALAADNWRSIEGSLNARLTAMEKERDDAIKHETEVRKKTREQSIRIRQLLDDLDKGGDETNNLEERLLLRDEEIKKLEQRVQNSEKALRDARSDFEQQRLTLEAQAAARVQEAHAHRRASNSISNSHQSRDTPSPVSLHRKVSAVDNILNSSQPRKPVRNFSHDRSSPIMNSFFDYRSPHSRRPSAMPSDLRSPGLGPDSLTSPPLLSSSRKYSTLSLTQITSNGSMSNDPPMPTPSIATEADFGEESGHSSPRGTIAAGDLISASTVHTGPSVQLVERMSSSIRRLEAEKASFKDEIERLLSQRDEARDQLVDLLREGEKKDTLSDELKTKSEQFKMLEARYEACLEMLGEREEEVVELKGDLDDMKRIYKELAEQMGRD